MRTLRAMAGAALTLALLGCTNSPGTTASAPRSSSPGPAASNPADSKAADLRTRFDLLLDEHVILIAKESTAAIGPAAAFSGYARLLNSNGSALGGLIRSAFGDTTGGQFDQLWSVQNGYLVDYTIGLVTHNQTKSNGAISGLLNGFVPEFSRLMQTLTQLPADSTTQVITQQWLETKAMIDDQIARNFPKMYADLRTAYAQASRIGDAIAPRIALKFPDKFPGTTSSQAVDLRVSVNSLLQEHAYLATMATSAAVARRAPEQAAATRALTDNGRALSALFSGLFGAAAEVRFDQIWAAKTTAILGYASASGGKALQGALMQLTDVYVTQFSGFVQAWTGFTLGTLRAAIDAQIVATITVIDDQRSRSWGRLGADDRSAGVSAETVADLIVGAAVAKLPLRFGA